MISKLLLEQKIMIILHLIPHIRTCKDQSKSSLFDPSDTLLIARSVSAWWFLKCSNILKHSQGHQKVIFWPSQRIFACSYPKSQIFTLKNAFFSMFLDIQSNWREYWLSSCPLKLFRGSLKSLEHLRGVLKVLKHISRQLRALFLASKYVIKQTHLKNFNMKITKCRQEYPGFWKCSKCYLGCFQ